MSNLSARLSTRKMPHRDVPICLDLALLERLDAANRAVVDATVAQGRDQRFTVSVSPALSAAQSAVVDAKAAIRDASFVIRVTGVDRTTYNQFLLDCPPRKGHQESFDPTRFFMHVAQETGEYVDEDGAVHPITGEEWDEIDRMLTDGEHDRLAAAVIEVNRTVGSHGLDFFGNGSETTRDFSETSGSPAGSGSRPAASGVGNRKKSTAAKK